MFIPTNYVEITGLSNSGTSDDAGTWNTNVDLSGFTSVPAGATGVVILVRETAEAAARWGGVRTSGKTNATFLYDLGVGDQQTIFVDLAGGTTLDFYRESADVTFHIAAWTDADVTYYDVDGTPPELPSTSSSISTVALPSGVPSGESLLVAEGRWSSTGNLSDVGDPETSDDLGNDIYRGDIPVPVHNDQIRINTGTGGTRVIASVSGSGFVKDWKNAVTVTADGTYQTPAQANSSAGGVIAAMHPGETDWNWAWRRNGDTADLPAVRVETFDYQPLVTSVDYNGEWQYRAGGSDAATELLVLGWGVDNSSTGPTIDSAPGTLVRTGTGYTIDVTSDDTSGHTVDIENSGGTTVESQTVNSITDNGDGTVTIEFSVVPGSLTIGATDHVLRVTDSNGNDTQTGITLRHPRVYVQAEADDGSNLSAGASWWARESEGQAPVDSGSVNFDGNGVGLLTFANTSVAPGGTLIVDSKYNGDARRAISELTIE